MPAYDTNPPMRSIRLFAAAALLAVVSLAHAAQTGNLYQELKEMRRRVDDLAEHATAPSGDISTLDEALTNLGFPKPNPMLAE